MNKIVQPLLGFSYETLSNMGLHKLRLNWLKTGSATAAGLPR
jgi:hypothetical protein